MSKNGGFAKSEITAMTHGQCSRADSPMPCQPGSPVLVFNRCFCPGVNQCTCTHTVCVCIGYVTLHQLQGGNFHTLKHYFLCSTIPEENEGVLIVQLGSCTDGTFQKLQSKGILSSSPVILKPYYYLLFSATCIIQTQASAVCMQITTLSNNHAKLVVKISQ